MKVLIVDDSEPMRRMINTFIADLAMEIFECTDGSEALGAYCQHQPDLILMDLKMNTMDGLEATKQIKQIYPLARIVIVSQWEDAGLLEASAALVPNTTRNSASVTTRNKKTNLRFLCC